MWVWESSDRSDNNCDSAGKKKPILACFCLSAFLLLPRRSGRISNLFKLRRGSLFVISGQPKKEWPAHHREDRQDRRLLRTGEERGYDNGAKMF